MPAVLDSFVFDESEKFLDKFQDDRNLNLDDSINTIIDEHPENQKVKK